MTGSPNFPLVKRRTVTIDQTRVVKDVDGDNGLRIIRSSNKPRTKTPSKDFEATRSEAPALEATVSTPEPAPISAPVSTTPPTPTVKIAAAKPLIVRSEHGIAPRDGHTVLVVNASQEMAREITIELSGVLPGCSILFAPTLSLALWILKRRSIDLVLTSAMLPDGPLSKLHECLELMNPPPELVVLSNLGTSRSHMGSSPGYRFVELRRVSTLAQGAESPPAKETSIADLGADLRNDLNNPLQEIVAMAFVAQASHGLSPVAEQALEAIERAAENMATVVKGLEDKIRVVVSRTAA